MLKRVYGLCALLLLIPSLALAAYESLGQREDSPASDGQIVVPSGCVRQDTLAGSTSADGDYSNIKCTSVGRLYTSATIDAALPAGANAIGSVTITSIVPGTGATALGKPEDGAHVSGDTGIMALCVRHDVSSTGIGVDGDYAPCAVNANQEVYTSANTELPAAATLADNTANPTVPGVAAFLMCFDGTTWDRCQPSVTDTDDNSVAFSQSTSLLIGLNHVSDGTSWIRTRTYLEDVASAGGEQLSLVGAVRQDTPAGSTSADGDYTYLKTDSLSALWVNCRAGCSGGTQYAEDAAAVSGDTGTMALAVRQDTPAGSTSADGDYTPLKSDSVGRLWVNCGTGCSGGTQYAEDAASAGAETLTLAGAVRQDSLASSTSADGDYGTLKLNSVGRLYTTATVDAALPAGNNNIGDVDVVTMPGTGTEDAAETAGGTLVMVGGVRRDTQAGSSGSDGDNSTFNLNALGGLYVQATAGTSGGSTPCYITSGASTNATNCKASGGNLYSIEAINTTATLYYLRLYNLSTSPTCSSATGFVRTIPVPASTTGAGIVIDKAVGEAYGTGLGFCLTGGGASTDNTNAATGVYVTLNYK